MFFSLCLTFLLLLYLHFFISFPFVTVFIFYHLSNSFVVFCWFYYLYVMFTIICLYWDGLFTKKEFILSLSFASGTIIVSVLHVRQFIKVKTYTSVPPISSDSLFWWLLLVCLKVIMLLELHSLGFLLYPYCSHRCPALGL